MNLGKIKMRYIFAVLVVAVSIWITPWCIEIADKTRGYKSYGGEYLIIPMGIVAGFSIISFAYDLDKLKRTSVNEKNK